MKKKNLQMWSLWYYQRLFFFLFVFWNIKSFQSCLVLHGLHFYKEKKKKMLFCCFVSLQEGSRLKLPPRGMSFNCIVELRPAFPDFKKASALSLMSTLNYKSFKMGQIGQWLLIKLKSWLAVFSSFFISKNEIKYPFVSHLKHVQSKRET